MRNFWISSSFEADSVASQGRSGGLLSIWDSSIFSKSNCLKGSIFLIISGRVKGVDLEINIANIYAPRIQSARERLWAKLSTITSNTPSIWVLIGDFN